MKVLLKIGFFMFVVLTISFDAQEKNVYMVSEVKESVDTKKVEPVKTVSTSKELSKIYTNSMGMEFVLIPEGEYMMGCSEGDKKCGNEEKPAHKVKISKPFYMGKYEVTRGEFRKFVKDTKYQTEAEKEDGCYGWTGSRWEKDKKYNWENVGFEQNDKHPVVCVSWNDVQEYVKWLNEKQATSRDVTFGKYHLPTEAEWEYAARGGTKTKYYWGDEIGKNNANCDRCGSEWDDKNTAPVGSFKPNAWGLYDMSGNVWEWCEDWFDVKYYEEKDIVQTDPINSTSSAVVRVIRGGSWGGDPRILRVSYRGRLEPAYRGLNFGFRVALYVQ